MYKVISIVYQDFQLLVAAKPTGLADKFASFFLLDEDEEKLQNSSNL